MSQAPASQSSFGQILRSSSIYAIAVFVSRLASFFLLPLYTRALSPADYGVLELLDITLYLYTSLVGFRLGEALFYFLQKATSEEERNRVAFNAWFGAILFGIPVTLVGVGLSYWLSQIVFGSPQYDRAFHLVFVGFATGLSTDVVLNYLRALDRPMAYVVASISRLLFNIALNVFLLVGLHWGFYGVLWGNIVSNLVLTCALSVFVLNRTGFTPDWSLLKRMSSYGWTLSLSGAAMLVIHYGDRYLLRHYVSLSEIGIYSLGYKIGMIISYLQQPFDIYWRAQMFSVVKLPDGDRVYVRICTYLLLTLTGATLLITVFARPFFEAIAGPAFQDAQYLAPWIAAVYTIRVVGTHFRSVFLIEGKPRLELNVTWIASTVCLIAYLVLIPWLRLWGAVIATGIAFTWMGVQGFVQAQRLRHFPYEYRRMLQVTGAAIVVVVLHHLWDPPLFLTQTLWATAAFALFPLLLKWLGFFTPGEWRRLKSLPQRLRFSRPVAG